MIPANTQVIEISTENMITTQDLIYGDSSAGGEKEFPEGWKPDMTWPQAVKNMADFYQYYIHTYKGKNGTTKTNWGNNENCPFKPNGYNQITDDCTGFVASCLWLYASSVANCCGSQNGNGSVRYYPKNDIGRHLVRLGFQVYKYDYNKLKPWDIKVGPTHVEICSGDNPQTKVYGWGSIHDIAHGGMPSASYNTNYLYIWRLESIELEELLNSEETEYFINFYEDSLNPDSSAYEEYIRYIDDETIDEFESTIMTDEEIKEAILEESERCDANRETETEIETETEESSGETEDTSTETDEETNSVLQTSFFQNTEEDEKIENGFEIKILGTGEGDGDKIKIVGKIESKNTPLGETVKKYTPILSWPECVKRMGKWYEANVHLYSQSNTSRCVLKDTAYINGVAKEIVLFDGQVRWDCSGFIWACLTFFAQNLKPLKTNSIPSSADFANTNGEVAAFLKDLGFTKITKTASVSYEPFDIKVWREGGKGHVEIVAAENSSKRSWQWGSCHDGRNGKPGMPCWSDTKKPYQTIWRLTKYKEFIPETEKRTDKLIKSLKDGAYYKEYGVNENIEYIASLSDTEFEKLVEQENEVRQYDTDETDTTYSVSLQNLQDDIEIESNTEMLLGDNVDYQVAKFDSYEFDCDYGVVSTNTPLGKKWTPVLTWPEAVKVMGIWYYNNVHDYDRSGALYPTKCHITRNIIDANGNKKVVDIFNHAIRADCSGFVWACLELFAQGNFGYLTASGGFFGKGLIEKPETETFLTELGFTKIAMNTKTFKYEPFDIKCVGGHVEIVAAGKYPNATGKLSWHWGSPHDSQRHYDTKKGWYTAPGMPCPSAQDPYHTVWRLTKYPEFIPKDEKYTDYTVGKVMDEFIKKWELDLEQEAIKNWEKGYEEMEKYTEEEIQNPSEEDTTEDVWEGYYDSEEDYKNAIQQTYQSSVADLGFDYEDTSEMDTIKSKYQKEATLSDEEYEVADNLDESADDLIDSFDYTETETDTDDETLASSSPLSIYGATSNTNDRKNITKAHPNKPMFYENRSWAGAVLVMAQWYLNNSYKFFKEGSEDYKLGQQGLKFAYCRGDSIPCDELGGMQVRLDCSGFVWACLLRFGVNFKGNAGFKGVEKCTGTTGQTWNFPYDTNMMCRAIKTKGQDDVYGFYQGLIQNGFYIYDWRPEEDKVWLPWDIWIGSPGRKSARCSVTPINPGHTEIYAGVQNNIALTYQVEGKLVAVKDKAKYRGKYHGKFGWGNNYTNEFPRQAGCIASLTTNVRHAPLAYTYLVRQKYSTRNPNNYKIPGDGLMHFQKNPDYTIFFPKSSTAKKDIAYEYEILDENYENPDGWEIISNIYDLEDSYAYIPDDENFDESTNEEIEDDTIYGLALTDNSSQNYGAVIPYKDFGDNVEYFLNNYTFTEFAPLSEKVKKYNSDWLPPTATIWDMEHQSEVVKQQIIKEAEKDNYEYFKFFVNFIEYEMPNKQPKTWCEYVENMAYFYVNYIGKYSHGNGFYCPLISPIKSKSRVRGDCTGFIGACLQYFGVPIPGASTPYKAKRTKTNKKTGKIETEYVPYVNRLGETWHCFPYNSACFTLAIANKGSQVMTQPSKDPCDYYNILHKLGWSFYDYDESILQKGDIVMGSQVTKLGGSNHSHGEIYAGDGKKWGWGAAFKKLPATFFKMKYIYIIRYDGKGKEKTKKTVKQTDKIL